MLRVTLASVSSDGKCVVGVTVRCDRSVTSVGCLSYMVILTRPVYERVMEPLKIKCVIAVIVMVVGGWVMRWILVTLACVVMSILMMSLSLTMMSLTLAGSLASLSFMIIIISMI